MISHIKSCKQRETNYKNSLLAAGFTTTPSVSTNNAALITQPGFQMFSSSASAKSAPTSTNAQYFSTPASSIAPSTATSTDA